MCVCPAVVMTKGEKQEQCASWRGVTCLGQASSTIEAVHVLSRSAESQGGTALIFEPKASCPHLKGWELWH